MKILSPGIEHVSVLSSLLDEYRQFYHRTSDLTACRSFVEERLGRRDSLILLAVNDSGVGLGFTQLYPSFSTVGLEKLWILNDLFVTSSARRAGVAETLMRHAHNACVKNGVTRLKLATGVENQQAKALYEKLGYTKIKAFDHYIKAL